MDKSPSDTEQKISNPLDAFKLSSDHLYQLLDYHLQEPDRQLHTAIKRAINAHIEITRRLHERLLSTAREPAQRVEDRTVPSKRPPPIPARSPADENPSGPELQRETPWAYLNIPNSRSGKLGPMPRFIPLQQRPNDTEDE